MKFENQIALKSAILQVLHICLGLLSSVLCGVALSLFYGNFISILGVFMWAVLFFCCPPIYLAFQERWNKKRWEKYQAERWAENIPLRRKYDEGRIKNLIIKGLTPVGVKFEELKNDEAENFYTSCISEVEKFKKEVEGIFSRLPKDVCKKEVVEAINSATTNVKDKKALFLLVEGQEVNWAKLVLKK